MSPPLAVAKKKLERVGSSRKKLKAQTHLAIMMAKSSKSLLSSSPSGRAANADAADAPEVGV